MLHEDDKKALLNLSARLVRWGQCSFAIEHRSKDGLWERKEEPIYFPRGEALAEIYAVFAARLGV